MKRMIASWTATALVLGLFSASASAMTVVYSWSPSDGSGGVGSLTISDPGITDPGHFNVSEEAALIDLSYQWDNGATIDFDSVTSVSALGGWSACVGTLITGFNITANPASGTFSLQSSAGNCLLMGDAVMPQPGAAMNGTNSAAYGAEVNYGQWTYSHTVVPVPGALWLLGGALGGLGMLRRRQKAAA